MEYRKDDVEYRKDEGSAAREWRGAEFSYLPYRNISFPLAMTIFCRRRIF
jgi:hypothetical protein